MASTLYEILNGFDYEAGELPPRRPFAGINKNPGVPSVVASAEFRRIEALPRRVVDLAAVEDVTPIFRRPGGTMSLRPIQSAALIDAAMMGGGFFPIGVGQGKCARGDTEIYDLQRGRRRVDEAREFVTSALDEQKQMRSFKALAAPSGHKECAELHLADGSKVVLSQDHPILTQRGWVRLDELRVTDLVAVGRRVTEPIEALMITDDEVKLSAYLLADGALTHHPIFTDDNEIVLAEVEDLAGKIGDGSTRSKDRRSAAVNISLRGILPFLDKFEISRVLSKHKRVPGAFYLLSRQQLALFLNRFWTCDGHVGRNSLELVLASEDLIRDMRFLLTRLGIQSRVAYKKAKFGAKTFDAWRLVVLGDEIESFFSEIGLLFGQEEKCRALLRTRDGIVSNPNVDVVPIGRKELSEICEEGGFRKTEARDFTGATDGQFLSRKKFAAFCERFNYDGRFAWLASSDILWTKIKSITNVGSFDVYDVSVPEAENWLANGIVVHNTLLTLLLPTALDSKKTVLLVPPQLRNQLRREIDELYNKHFFVPLDVITIVAYSELSLAKNSDLLERLDPDLLILDEAHMARHRSSARTKRICRFLKGKPACRSVDLSGTITSRSLNDFGHLIEFALRKGSPVPRGYREVQTWAGALDVKPEIEARPGALKKFCAEGETIRQGFRRRLTESQGVIASSEDEVGSSLVIIRRTLKIPERVQKVYDEAKDSWSLEGEEFSDILTRSRVLRQIACGFYYRWRWPDGQVDFEWLEARANWNRAVREKLKQSRVGLDSPLLLANAAERALKIKSGMFKDRDGAHLWPAGADVWAAWKAVKDRPEPPTEAVWLDDFLLIDLERRATESAKDAPTIIWYEHVTVGERLAALTGWPLYDAGTDASASREQIIIASIATQGTGKNLQFFANNLFASLPPNGSTFQQTIARTHRPGQLADLVTASWYGHTEETAAAMDKIKADAIYQSETLGSPAKVLYAAHINDNEDIND